jgi:hypothetical protein
MWLGADDTAQTPSGTSPDNSDWLTNITAALPALASTVTGIISQQNLLDYNTQLIAQGKPPLTPAQLTQLQAGFTPGLNVGLGATTLTTVQNIAIGAGLLIAGIFVASSLTGGGSRRPARA